jgi:hypothetical protein
MLSAREEGELSHVETRLLARFVPPLEPEDVRRCVRESASLHGAARVRTYLSILIERTATALLRDAADAATSAAVVDLRSRVVIERSPGTEQVDLTVQRVEPAASALDDGHRRVG